MEDVVVSVVVRDQLGPARVIELGARQRREDREGGVGQPQAIDELLEAVEVLLAPLGIGDERGHGGDPLLAQDVDRLHVGVGAALGALADRVQAGVVDPLDAEEDRAQAGPAPAREQVAVAHDEVAAGLTGIRLAEPFRLDALAELAVGVVVEEGDVVGEEDVVLLELLQLTHDREGRPPARAPLVEDPDAAEVAIERAAAGGLHRRRARDEAVVVTGAVAGGERAVRQGQLIQLAGEGPRLEAVVLALVGGSEDPGDGLQGLAVAEGIHDADARPFPLPDRHRIHSRAGVEEVVGHEAGMVAAHHHGQGGPALLEEPRHLQRRVDVGGEGAADPDRGRRIVDGAVQRVPGIEPKVHHLRVVAAGAHRASHALQPEGLAGEDPREAEARSLRGLDEEYPHGRSSRALARRAFFQAMSLVMTFPLTSVSRKSRPWKRYVSRVCSMPISCRTVACTSWTSTASSTAL